MSELTEFKSYIKCGYDCNDIMLVHLKPGDSKQYIILYTSHLQYNLELCKIFVELL